MEQYIKDWYVSRGVEIWEEPLPCEHCLYLLMCWDIKSWVRQWIDVHHILSSNRWKRKHNVNGETTILLCRQCHSLLHDNNGWINREFILAIVKETIMVYKRMAHKEKLWALVEYLYSKIKHDKIKWVHQETD